MSQRPARVPVPAQVMPERGRTGARITGPGEPGGTITIVRKHQPWGLWLGSVDVEIDGRRAGKLAEGERLEVRAGPGEHRLRVRLGPAETWGVATVWLEDGAEQGVLVSLRRQRHRAAGAAAILLVGLAGGHGFLGRQEPTYTFEDLSSADPGRPLEHIALIPWVVLGIAAALARGPRLRS